MSDLPDTDHVADLYAAYRFIIGRDSSLPSDLADEFGHNMRYSRELLGALVGAKLIVLDTSTDMDFYVAKPIPEDKQDSTFAKAFKIDKPVTSTAAGTPAKVKPAKPVSKDYHPCGCGCGENVPPKSAYRPGHDARHAGAVGRAIAAEYPNVLGDAGLKGEIEKQISPDRPLLVAKAIKVAHTAWAKAAAKKRHPSGAVQPTEGVVSRKLKAGPTDYPARQFSDGSVEYLFNGEWTKAGATIAKTFQAG